MTVSRLLYEERNPQGYGWARVGLVICGVCGLYWVLKAVRGRGVTTGSLAGGYSCMVLCAVLPSTFLGVAKCHEILAVAAFMAICTGVTRLTFGTLTRGEDAFEPMARRRLGALAVSSLPLLPVVLAAAAVTYASHAHLPWVSLAWRARGIPVYWSFAFWEWLACAIYSVFLLWLIVSKGATDDASFSRRG